MKESPSQSVTVEHIVPIEPNLYRDEEGKILWRSLLDNPDLMTAKLEEEAKAFFEENGDLSHSSLRKANERSLLNAIQNFYPGQLRQLQEKVGIRSPRVPYKYLTIPETGLPRDRGDRLVTSVLRDNPDELKRRIEEEARNLMANGVSLEEGSPKSKNKAKFFSAVYRFYPGGRAALGLKVGLKITESKPPGYWQEPINIEVEVLKLLASGIELTQDNLHIAGKYSLATHIPKYYPGGMAGLKDKLGIKSAQKPFAYWKDTDNIEAAARAIMDQYGTSSLPPKKVLEMPGNGSFYQAVKMYYPGGIKALREKLGCTKQNAANELLDAYEGQMNAGEPVGFSEFVKNTAALKN